MAVTFINSKSSLFADVIQVLLQKENNKMIDFRLKFVPKDIKYIFVKNENEIHEMVKKLRNIKQQFSPKEIDILTSKILTTEQIKEDF